MIVLPGSPEIVRHVALNMRELSAREILGNSVIATREGLADALEQTAPFVIGLAALAGDDGRPTLLVGVMPVAPGRGGMIFVATAEFPAITLPAHRWWFRHFVPEVLMQFRRVEFVGIEEPALSAWRRRLGFRQEGVARAYGCNGENYGHWAWVHPDHGPAED